MPAGSGAQNGGGALGVNLSSGSRVSGVSSRRRRARRGPGGCRRTAAAPGPAPHDRAEASGSRAQLMPCRGQPASGRAPGSSRGQGILSSDARENRVQCQAQITAAAPARPARAPAFARRLGVAGARSGWGLLYCCSSAAPSVSSFPPPLCPPSPFLPVSGAFNLGIHKFRKFPSPSRILESSVPGMDPLHSPLGTEIK